MIVIKVENIGQANKLSDYFVTNQNTEMVINKYDYPQYHYFKNGIWDGWDRIDGHALDHEYQIVNFEDYVKSVENEWLIDDILIRNKEKIKILYITPDNKIVTSKIDNFNESYDTSTTKEILELNNWKNKRIEDNKILELTIEDIAKKYNVNPNQIRIKE